MKKFLRAGVITVMAAALAVGLSSPTAQADTHQGVDAATIAKIREARQSAPASPMATATTTRATRFADDALTENVISRYDRWITRDDRGYFVNRIPVRYYFSDPEGAWAAHRAVKGANRTIRAQVHALNQAGEQVSAADYRYGQPLPMGPHATFTPLWWGMVFTLDAYAAGQLNDALTGVIVTLETINAVLGLIGAVIAPAVKAAFVGIVKALGWIVGIVRDCTTEDGLVIKSLWLPIVWCEKPTGPFQPAV